MSTPDPSPTTRAIAAAIADAVGRQLSQFVSALAQQVDGAHRAIDTARAELRAEFAEQVDLLRTTFDEQARALESRLVVLADQHRPASIDPEELRALRSDLDVSLAALGERLDTDLRAAQQRIADVERRASENLARLDAVAAQIEGTGDDSLDKVKEQLSSAVGEVMLVRIELDRIVAATDEKIGKATLRMAEIESLLADEMDVSTTVQLERLDELERAIAEIDPELGRRVHETDTDTAAAAPSVRMAPATSPSPASPPPPGAPVTPTGPDREKARRLSSF